ncbi:MAG TPA: hypothetical protein DCR55_16560, partial [Lentisphaeria bacterium]|nr:hypothetical protein [Lentisphaeria bacterium]
MDSLRIPLAIILPLLVAGLIVVFSFGPGDTTIGTKNEQGGGQPVATENSRAGASSEVVLKAAKKAGTATSLPSFGDPTATGKHAFRRSSSADPDEPAGKVRVIQRLNLEKFEPEFLAALEISNRAARQDRLRMLAVQLAYDPDAAYEFVEMVTDRSDQNVLAHAIATQMMQHDMEGGMEWGVGLPSAYRSLVVNVIASKWVTANREEAIEWVTAQEDETAFVAAAQGVIRTLRQLDKDAAFAWAQELSEHALHQELGSTLVSVMAAADPSAAYEFARNLENEGTRNKAYVAIVQAISRTDPAAATEWAASLPDASTRQQGLMTASSRWAQQDPEGAATWLAELGDGNAKNSALSTVLRTWSSRDPESAASWVADMDLGSAHSSVVMNIARSWGAKDPAAAVEWIGTLEDSKIQNR